jgi:hypothetical protein
MLVWSIALATCIPWFILSGAGWLADRQVDVMDRLWKWTRS